MLLKGMPDVHLAINVVLGQTCSMHSNSRVKITWLRQNTAFLASPANDTLVAIENILDGFWLFPSRWTHSSLWQLWNSHCHSNDVMHSMGLPWGSHLFEKCRKIMHKNGANNYILNVRWEQISQPDLGFQNYTHGYGDLGPLSCPSTQEIWKYQQNNRCWGNIGCKWTDWAKMRWFIKKKSRV